MWLEMANIDHIDFYEVGDPGAQAAVKALMPKNDMLCMKLQTCWCLIGLDPVG